MRSRKSELKCIREKKMRFIEKNRKKKHDGVSKWRIKRIKYQLMERRKIGMTNDLRKQNFTK